MKKILLVLMTVFIVTQTHAAVRWTDNGNWRGAGVGVANVYLQWDQHWVQFYGSDGKSYYYYWGTNEMPDEKAKMFFSMLLTAFTADKKVSIAYETTPSASGEYAFSYLNLHN